MRHPGPDASDPVEDPLQAGAVHLHDGRDELLGQVARRRAARRASSACLQLLDALEQRARTRPSSGCRRLCDRLRPSPVGVWITLRTLPLPVYMCTPHGRHGSNERTARMMSTPLKFSGPFSSKIGVFCTASS